MPADQPTPAETIRAAATRLREAAEKAMPGPWTSNVSHERTDISDPNVPEEYWTAEVFPLEADGESIYWTALEDPSDTAAYIALVSPVVGLALADWLDLTAETPAFDAFAAGRKSHVARNISAALAVARTLLAPSGEEGGR